MHEEVKFLEILVNFILKICRLKNWTHSGCAMSAVSKLIVANLKRDVRRAWLLRTSEIAHTLAVVVRRGTTVQSTLAILLCVVRVVVCSSFMPDGSPLLRSRLVVVGFSDGVNYAPILGPNFSSFTLFEKSKSKSLCSI